MVDYFSIIMFVLACLKGRSRGSLFIGALVGCFVLFTYLEGGRMLYLCTSQSRNTFFKRSGVGLWLLWTVLMAWLSLRLPLFLLSVTGSSI